MKCLFEGCRRNAIRDSNFCKDHEWNARMDTCYDPPLPSGGSATNLPDDDEDAALVGDPPVPGDG
jgi:hypothetical protein